MQKKINEIEIQLHKTYHFVTTLWLFVMFFYLYIILMLSLAFGKFIGDVYLF